MARYFLYFAFFVSQMGSPVLGQDISTMLMNTEKPLVDKEAARKIAKIVLKTYYGRDHFIPGHHPEISEEAEVWIVKYENANHNSDLYSLGFQSATLTIRKKDGAILSVSR